MRDFVLAAVAILAACLLVLTPMSTATAQVWVSVDGQTVYTPTQSKTVTYSVTPGPATYVPVTTTAPVVYSTAPAWRSGLVGSVVGGVSDGIASWRVAHAERVIANTRARQAARAAYRAAYLPAVTYSYLPTVNSTYYRTQLPVVTATVTPPGGWAPGIYYTPLW